MSGTYKQRIIEGLVLDGLECLKIEGTWYKLVNGKMRETDLGSESHKALDKILVEKRKNANP